MSLPFNIKIYLKCMMVIVLSLFSTQAIALNQEEIFEQIRALDWQTNPGEYQLSDSNAKIITTSEEYLLLGEEAHKYMRLSEGHDGFKPNALIIRIDGPYQDTQVLYTFHEIGYVKMDDWEEHINKDQLLTEIIKSTEEANKIKEAGYPSLHVDGWAQEPMLDKDNAIIYWAISAHSSDGNSIINAKAIKLGRKGFSEIVWMGTPSQFKNAEISLSPSLAAYQYEDGSKYKDFIPGADTVAAVGAGALAYKLITGKAAAKAGAGFLAVILVFAKKLWFLIFLPFVYAWKWFKNLFTGNKE